MSYYYEYAKSGEGDSTGLSGLDASRTFVVVIDKVGDDPITVIQGYGTEPQDGIAIGAPHPNQNRFPYAVAFDYIKEEQKAPLVWIIRIPYKLPSAATVPVNEWLLRWSVATETELLKTDLTGKPIGSHSYMLAPKPDEPTGKRTSTTNFYAFNGKRKLVRLEGGRRHTGLSRTRPVHSFTLSRTLSQVQAYQLAIVAKYDNKINRTPLWPVWGSRYYMFDKGLVKFVGMDFREETAVMEGQTSGGIVYPIELSFAVNLDGWSPVTQYDVWSNDRGDESVVTADDGGDEPVSDTFMLYEEANLQEIIFALGGGSIRIFGART